MEYKFTNSSPIYLQLAKTIKHYIVSGIYGSGCKLPTVRDLALEAHVNPNTVQKAYQELEREGLVICNRTSGRFVTDQTQAIEQLRHDLSKQYIEELFTHLSVLGFTEEQIKTLVTTWEVNHESTKM